MNTSGIFFINKHNKLLVAHATGHPNSSWTIPKGKLDNEETDLEAAIRET